MGEWNNIPTTKKFSSAYFTLLNEDSVSSTTTVNCVPQEPQIFFIYVYQMRKEKCWPRRFGHIEKDDDRCSLMKLSLFVVNILSYIAGWTLRSLSATIAHGDAYHHWLKQEDLKQIVC